MSSFFRKELTDKLIMQDKIFKKNFIWNMIGTTLYSFNSLFFMIVITRINGTQDAGIFTLLFSVCCLLFNVGIYAGRTYQVTDKIGKYNDTDYFVQRILSVFLMLLLGGFYALFKKLDFYRFSLVLLLTVMKCMEAFADCIYGILQKHECLYKSGISLTIKSIASLIALIVVDLFFHNLIISFIIVDIFCLIITLLYDIPSIKMYLKNSVSIEKALSLFVTGFFSFAFYFLNVYLSNAPKYALDGHVNSSEQALFSIVLMPATLISLCAIYLLQPYINKLSILFQEKNHKEFIKLIRLILLGIVCIGVIAFIGATILGIPVLNLVYNVDLSDYLRSLQIIIIGGTLYAMSTVLSTALTTFRNTKVQFYIYVVVSVIIFIGSGYFINTFGVYGGAYIYALSTVLQFVLYYIAYHKDLKNWIHDVKG